MSQLPDFDGTHQDRPVTPAATRVLILSGSLRAAAMTTQIATVALTAAPPGVITTLAENLNTLPFYNQDLDTDDPPTAATTLRQLVDGADAVLFVSPANNGSVSAVLKNAIDWLSRPRDAAALQDKPVALLVTGHATETVEAHLEHVLTRAGATVVPSSDRALSIRSFGGKQPADVPAVIAAVTSALTALARAA